MTDIRQFIFDTVGADVAFKALTGATASDPRIYWYYQGDAEITTGVPGAKPAYVTVILLASPEIVAAIGSPVWSFQIWGRYVDAVLGVRDRLVALFDKERLITGTSRELYGKLVQEQDSFQQQSDFAGVQLHFRFGYLSLG